MKYRLSLLTHLLFIVAFVACAVIVTTRPSQADQSIVGTGDPDKDIAHLQKAADAGGTILLRGTFNLGSEGRIKLTKDCRIRGEEQSSGLPTTTIKGGFWTFYSPLPVPGAPPSKRGPIIALKALRFTGAKGTPLHFPYLGGLDVRDCTVTDLRPQEVTVKWAQSDTMHFMAGIVIGNRLESRQKRVDRATQGTIRVEDNRFYMECDKPDITAGYGVMADWTWGVDMGINHNTIIDASRNGIEVLDNILTSKGEGNIVINGNRITTPDTGIPYPHKFGPNGIVAGWYFNTAGGANFSMNNRIALSANRIEARGENSTGLLLYANDIVATCNDIIMGGGKRSRGIVQTGSRGFFANNRIRGEARFALYCHPFETLRGETNTFAWTELNDFTGIKGQVFLGGNVNVIIGSLPMVEDKGKGNRLVEVTPCALPEVDPENAPWE